ncbi:hypothetical protein M8C13_07320 [Crossiella sp. SN42]|uniref:hypothetical protein n=1 Tax=Crossiella sp. SN42 TaxID=2944808 RepID=UPI00207CAAD5|nr:hypothetical protein [Crossiella sp. SN42]MCO1575567.1 hypothetical protein [Crossiella sp. SN42]
MTVPKGNNNKPVDVRDHHPLSPRDNGAAAPRLGIITPRPTIQATNSLRWYPLEPSDTIEPIPDLPLVYTTRACGPHKHNSALDTQRQARASQMLRLNEHRLTRLVQLLELENTALQGTALCHSTASEGIAYNPLTVGTRTHHMAAQATETLPETIADVDELHLITGASLLSPTAVSLRSHDGHRAAGLHADPGSFTPVAHVAVDDHLTLYEWELIVRLAAAITDLVSTLPLSQLVVIWLDVPDLQPYLHLLHHAAQAPVANQAVLAHWWAENEARSTRLRGLLKYYVQRGLAGAGRIDVPIHEPAGLSPLKPTLRRQLHTSPTHVDLPRLLALLETDPIWARMLTLIRPADPAQLALYSAVSRLLRPGLGRPATSRTVTLAVDSPADRRTLGVARDLAASVPGYTGHLAGVYPMPRILLSGNGAISHAWISPTVTTPEGDLSVRDLAHATLP